MRRTMTFEECLYNLKAGKKMTRQGWASPSTMYLFLTPAGAVQVPNKYGDGYHVQAIVWIKTRDDAIVPWLCSQTDLLADDWMMVGSGELQQEANQMIRR